MGTGMKTLHILSVAGIGDNISNVARLTAVYKEHGDIAVKFWLGGYGKSPQFSKELIDRVAEKHGFNLKAAVVKNLTVHGQIPDIIKFIKSSPVVYGDDDMFEDWSFCNEIFNNQEIPQSRYDIADGFDYSSEELSASAYSYQELIDMRADKRVIAIHPITTAGNHEGFEWHEQHGRFWNKEKWQQLLLKLEENDCVPLFTGIGDEDWGLVEWADKEMDYIDARGLNIQDTIDVLNMVDGCISVNTWDWEITARRGIPTYVFYTTDVHVMFYKVHCPARPGKFWDSCFVEKDRNVSVDQVFDVFEHMYKTNKRPEVDYSVCMITYDDKDVININLKQLLMYRDQELVVIDGGSTDGTLSKLKLAQNMRAANGGKMVLEEIPWADNFEIQKNAALDKAKNEWRVWIDADETYEHLFWNQLPWYIWLAEKEGMDCISVPRINTIEGVTQEELMNYAQRNGWQLSGYNWIQYPDHQQRIFNSKCRFVGRTHERIVGFDKQGALAGVHCIHPKSKERQERGLAREEKQYRIEAEKVKARIEAAEKRED